MMTRPGLVAASGAALVLACALAGCAPATPMGPGAAGDAAGTWGVDKPGEPNLTLSSDGQLSGSDGCNRLVGTWSQTGSTVDFGEVASTMMACQNVDTWLSGLSNGRVDGTTLHVLDADGAEIGTLTR